MANFFLFIRISAKVTDHLGNELSELTRDSTRSSYITRDESNGATHRQSKAKGATHKQNNKKLRKLLQTIKVEVIFIIPQTASGSLTISM